MNTDQSNQVIDALGGTVKVSRIFSVTKGAVSQWRKTGIPASRELYIRAVWPAVVANTEDKTKEAA